MYKPSPEIEGKIRGLVAFWGEDDDDKSHLRVRLNELIQAVAQDAAPKWQPIETAPKDGTNILVYGGGDDEDTYLEKDVFLSYWETGTTQWIKVDEDTMKRHVSSGLWYGVWEPTHWMPLHSPPEATE